MSAVDILIVDDEEDIRSLMRDTLRDEGYNAREAESAPSAYQAISESTPDLIILDIWLKDSDEDGMHILERVKAESPSTPVIMISGHGSIETAVMSLKKGAYDFIEKPFKTDRLILTVQRALEAARLKQENQALKKEIEGSAQMFGTSQAMKAIQQIIARVAATNSRVFITGPAGAGKNIAARILHHSSARKENAFVTLNCANLYPDRFDEELFGSEKEGGVIQVGALEKASGGTLLLDEVADMPLETQGKIVRVLQDKGFQRVGGKDRIQADVRIIATSNKDMDALIEEGLFREDLYYRLNVVPIYVPPLKDRIQDIPVLVEAFTLTHSEQSGLSKRVFTEEALIALQNYHWPGNIRQLRNVVEWIMIMCTEETVQITHLPPDITGKQGGADSRKEAEEPSAFKGNIMALSLKQAREVFERDYLLSQIHRFGGNISKTAKFVGMERSALHRKLKTLDIAGAGPNGQDKDESEKSIAAQEDKNAAQQSDADSGLEAIRRRA